jgi:hypothetical protein
MVALRKLRSERLWPIIHNTLAHSDNENLIETAIKAVGELGDEATESLLATIYEAGKRTRFGVQAAHKAARRLRDPQQRQQRRVPVARDKRKHLFVCHSSEDKTLIVEPIVAECGRQSVTCW